MDVLKDLAKTRKHIWPKNFSTNSVCARCEKTAQEMLDVIYETLDWLPPNQHTCDNFYICVSPNELLMIKANS